MAGKLADVEDEVEAALSFQPDRLTIETHANAAGLSTCETSPNFDLREYRLLYLPTMLGVYTARHQRMPASDESLRQHVFGNAHHAGCEACREETEFLVAHQKKFL